MVSVTKNTLSTQLPFYIRDVLRNNLTDPASRTTHWIFKSNPEMDFDTDDFPIIIIDVDTQSSISIGLDGSKYIPRDIVLGITIYHDDQKERDEIADEVRYTLLNPDSEDSNGDSLREKQIKCISITEATRDTYIKYPKMLRVKEMICTFRYYGG